MTTRIRTRFAPSPTGFIHLGNIRSALYPWAYARSQGGDFILRIEDTDEERSSQAAVDVILEGMAWLGLDADEGPFYQMQRMDRYREVLAQLKAAGHVYPCYMSIAELDALRERQMAGKLKPRYDGTWRPEPGKTLPPVPQGRIANTKKLLAAAAIIMSVLLMLSSFVTTLLLTPADYQTGGKASGRAIAFLAHKYLGSGFGTVYDISTILILWFAGASAMAGLLHLVPRYLPRLGMAPSWVAHARPLVLVLLVINIVVTIVFKADVEAQGGAYATGVLALMFSAAIAAAISLRKEGDRFMSWYCWAVALIFGYTLIENVRERPDGMIIASIFIGAIVVLSTISRSLRSVELRVSGFKFDSPESASLWDEMSGKKVNLVPVRTDDGESRIRKTVEIRTHYRDPAPLAFCHVELLDNRSEFIAPLRIAVERVGESYMIRVSQATAIANTIAYLSETLDPISLFLGLTRLNLISQAFRFLLVGEGETGLMVYAILLKYWAWTPEEDVRPYIYLMSD